MPYRSGIDGVRAIGLVAVLLYHADVSWMPAGFLGVDVFFVVSGYLITSLLTAEWRDSGQIGLRAFWTRRARRLLPALFVLLVAVTAIGPIVARDSVVALRGDVVPAIAYVSNWWQIVHRQSYFSVIGRPPLLRHVWSLAVEEQFYLLFPPALVLGLRLARGRIRLIGLAAAALGALSTLAMAVMWHPNADPSRIYYGTDTRAVGLCVGVALALFVPAHRLDPQVRPARRWLIDAIGAAGLVALVFLMVHL